jgi:hypothetical protein
VTGAVLGGAAILLAAGALLPVLMGARRRGARGAAARARSAHARLGHGLATTVGADPRAAERFTTAGAVLSRARTARDFALAERVAREGLDLLSRHEP